jgi:hypothetical protein
MVNQKIYTVVIDCTLYFVINLVVFPIWVIDHLHNSIIHNMEGGLVGYLQGKLWLETIINEK